MFQAGLGCQQLIASVRVCMPNVGFVLLIYICSLFPAPEFSTLVQQRISHHISPNGRLSSS